MLTFPFVAHIEANERREMEEVTRKKAQKSETTIV